MEFRELISSIKPNHFKAVNTEHFTRYELGLIIRAERGIAKRGETFTYRGLSKKLEKVAQ